MTYYIDYKENEYSNFMKRIIYRFLYKFSVINVDNDKMCIYINKKYINKKAYSKINKYLIKHNLDWLNQNVVIAKSIKVDKIKKSGILNKIKFIPKEKYIMKAMLQDILFYIEKILDIDFRNEHIYVAMISDTNKDVLFSILDMFKSINIVTTRLGRMRRMENDILKHKEAVISISNNKKKALKRARILINFDYSDELLNKFELNRNCIIIKLNISSICMKRCFQGCIIDSINIDFRNKYKSINKDNYDIDYLYSSYARDMDYKNIIKQVKMDNCKILSLVGNRGIITNNEIVNNFINSAIKLDKTQKKD